MYIQRPIRYIVLLVLSFTIPVHPKNLFNYCTDVFNITKQSIADVVNGPASTKTKVSVGLVALIITYALIHCVLYKYYVTHKKHATTPEQNLTRWDILSRQEEIIINRINKHAANLKRMMEESDVSPDAALISGIETIENDNYYDALSIRTQILQHREFEGSNLVSVVWGSPGMLDSLIRHWIQAGNLEQWQLTDGLWGVADKNLTMDKRDGIATLIRHGANINTKSPGFHSWFLPKYYERMQTPLTDAILVGAPAVVKIFLENNAAIDIEPGISAYDYVEDVGKYGGYHTSKEQVYAILDNHRRKLAKRYRPKVQEAILTHLKRDPTSIVMQYVDPQNYPLMHERPLTSFELVDDGCSGDNEQH